MKKRFSKKLHKKWLEWGVIDASQNSYWRKILFESEEYESFPIDIEQLEGILSEVARAIKKYNLHYLASKVSADEARPWLSGGGLMIFKFWAKDHPSVKMFSYLENEDCEKLNFVKNAYGETIHENFKIMKERGARGINSRGNKYYAWQRKIKK